MYDKENYFSEKGVLNFVEIANTSLFETGNNI